MRSNIWARSTVAVLALCAIAACRAETPQPKKQTTHAHTHAAPRGGVLAVLAEETAHVEILFDAATGRIDLYGLGPHASTPVRMAQDEIRLFLYRGGEAIRVILLPVASELTGETVGDTSHYTATDDRLAGAEKWNGHIASIDLRGQVYEQVKIAYPPR